MRGQGIKLLVLYKKNNERNYVDLAEKSTANDGYEGAIVLIPNVIYIETIQ